MTCVKVLKGQVNKSCLNAGGICTQLWKEVYGIRMEKEDKYYITLNKLKVMLSVVNEDLKSILFQKEAFYENICKSIK